MAFSVAKKRKKEKKKNLLKCTHNESVRNKVPRYHLKKNSVKIYAITGIKRNEHFRFTQLDLALCSSIHDLYFNFPISVLFLSLSIYPLTYFSNLKSIKIMIVFF